MLNEEDFDPDDEDMTSLYDRNERRMQRRATHKQFSSGTTETDDGGPIRERPVQTLTAIPEPSNLTVAETP